jgi:hypothetical protein
MNSTPAASDAFRVPLAPIGEPSRNKSGSFCQKYRVHHDLRAIKIGFVLPNSSVLIRHRAAGFVLAK